MSKYYLIHVLIVLLFGGCLVYGLTVRNQTGFTVTAIGAVVAIILMIINKKPSKKDNGAIG
ncbi:hypothetical protein SAMN05443252_101872 [Bacillus sp. OV322]|uniref:hypothetical protein n=1 Tax=Bacillus sp. OV322 TaxID=1882764 RepID=UPI0008EC7770|nr:hypothetical protein [Bacillus sp. OV322]SFC09835.1 hypothetical protein SAMN05443252_101872 [Bacillus sp. OV322]